MSHPAAATPHALPVPDPATAAAGAALLAWATGGQPSQAPRTVAVTGPRGAGKTRLLAWFLAATAD
ncbi:hypothetical protein, partial [Kitasatospora sp. NPDC057198]|uniref:hypothetical protein n=1 Tax=Kitasatospora sp. NPDC057198 TaxID=3346046 RepID=UPI003626F258